MSTRRWSLELQQKWSVSIADCYWHGRKKASADRHGELLGRRKTSNKSFGCILERYLACVGVLCGRHTRTLGLPNGSSLELSYQCSSEKIKWFTSPNEGEIIIRMSGCAGGGRVRYQVLSTDDECHERDWQICISPMMLVCLLNEYVRFSTGLVDKQRRRHERRARDKTVAESQPLTMIRRFRLFYSHWHQWRANSMIVVNDCCPNFVRGSAFNDDLQWVHPGIFFLGERE